MRSVHGLRGDRLLARDPTRKPPGWLDCRLQRHRPRAGDCSAPQPCRAAGLHRTGMPFSGGVLPFDRERVTSVTDVSRGPTDKQIGRKLAALREVMGFDVEALAAR